MSQDKVSKMPWSSWHNRLHKKLLFSEHLLPKGATLLLSVSGGQDSMALTQLLLDLQRLHHWKLHIWHGDHGWHNQSELIAKELEQWCRKKNLDFYCDHASNTETKTEESARDWRYTHLEQRAAFLTSQNKNAPCEHVLTGHTSTDRTETFIMNLSRGSDLTGLTSLREKRVLKNNIHLVRPCLGFSRKETEQICKDLKLPIWLDPSNKNLNFNRNKIREVILPILEELHKGSITRIASLSERLTYFQEDQKALALLAIEAISSEEGLSRIKLMLLPMSARSTLLYKWLEINKATMVSSTKVNELSKKISTNKSKGEMQISKNLKVVWSKDLVRIIYQDNEI